MAGTESMSELPKPWRRERESDSARKPVLAFLVAFISRFEQVIGTGRPRPSYRRTKYGERVPA